MLVSVMLDNLRSMLKMRIFSSFFKFAPFPTTKSSAVYPLIANWIYKSQKITKLDLGNWKNKGNYNKITINGWAAIADGLKGNCKV